MAKSDAEKKKDFLKKHGLKRFNSCVIRTEGNKKGKVGILVTGSPSLFASVTLLWVTTIPQKLGNLLNQGMQKILQKVQQVLRTGQTNVYGRVSQARRSLRLKVNEWLKEPEVKLSGRVYKAIKDKETVELIKE